MLQYAAHDEPDSPPKDDAPADPAPNLPQALKDWIDRHVKEEVEQERKAAAASEMQ